MLLKLFTLKISSNIIDYYFTAKMGAIFHAVFKDTLDIKRGLKKTSQVKHQKQDGFYSVKNEVGLLIT